MKLYLALILLLPLLGGTFNALFGRSLPRRVGETIACGVIWGAFACSVLAFLQFNVPVKFEYASWLSDFDFRAPIALYLDQLSLSLTLMITFVCGLILDTVTRGRQEAKRIAYLAIPGPDFEHQA